MSWLQSLNPGIRYVDLETDRGRCRPPGPSSIYDNDFDPGPVSDPEPFVASDSEPFVGFEEEEQRLMAPHGQRKGQQASGGEGAPSGQHKGEKKSGNGIHIL